MQSYIAIGGAIDGEVFEKTKLQEGGDITIDEYAKTNKVIMAYRQQQPYYKQIYNIDSVNKTLVFSHDVK